jgi:hypothetical protein
MNFRRCINFDQQNYKTPSLLIALRGDQKLYQEALKQFYSFNFFGFRPKTSQTYHHLLVKAVAPIRC